MAIYEKSLGWLARRSPVTQITLGLVAIAGIGFLDELTGAEISFSIFYLIPIIPVTWTAGRLAANILALFAGFVWLMVELTYGHAYTHPLFPYWNMLVRTAFFLVISALLLRLRDALRREQSLARMDFLTGVSNSRHFLETASLEIARCRRHHHPITVAYIDLDNFKTVNDTLGHAVGDALLAEVAATLLAGLRAEDVVARLGGDEFALLLVESDAAAALPSLERVRTLLADRMREHSWPVTFSIGAATFLDPPDSAEALIKAADTLMYEAKTGGKNAIRHAVFPIPSPHSTAPL